MRLRGRTGRAGTVWLITAALVVACATTLAPARQGPVASVDDSIRARDGLVRARELIDAGNEPEGLRVLQLMLESDGERVLESGGDINLHYTVRRHVHELLLASPKLLQRYHEVEEPKARQQLDAGALRDVERSRFLTRSGLVATLRLSQGELDAGRFESARLLLEQVEGHPDLATDRACAESAARVAGLLSRALPREDVDEAFRRIAARATALGAKVEAPTIKEPARPARVATPLDSGVGVDAAKIPAKALRAVPLANPWSDDEDDAPFGQRVTQRRSDPVVFPASAGRLLLVNDGERVTALESDTFAPLWSMTPSNDQERITRTDETYSAFMNGRTVEDVSSVTAGGLPRAGVVVATMGIARNGKRIGDPRVHGIDADSGQLIWSVDPALLEPSLDGSYVRGPAEVDADTVVLALRKQSPSARDTTVLLTGLDLYTGRVRWTRTMGVVGRLPWGVVQRRADGMLLDRGVVYRADEIGVVGAFESATGRPIWVRRMTANRLIDLRSPRGNDTLPAFALHVPVLVGNDLFIMEPGEGSILRLSARTGDLLGRRDSSAFGSTRYMLRVGDYLACVGTSRVGFVKASEFDAGTIHITPALGDFSHVAPNIHAIVGRVIEAGGQLLIPLSGMVAIIADPAKPQEITTVEMEGSGNLLSAGGTLVSADLNSMRSFIGWEDASEMLQARIAREPNATRAILAYVDLALQARKFDEAAPMAQRALDALDLAAAGGNTQAPGLGERRRLFDVLLPIAGPQAPSDPAVQDRLLSCLDRAAESPEERAAYLLSLGALRESRRQSLKAVEAYQGVLANAPVADAEPLLSSEQDAGTTARERATRRLVDLVTREGFGVYAAFADEAARSAAMMDASAAPDRLSALARQYPLAPASIELWSKTGEAYLMRDQTSRAVHAFGQGLNIAETLVRAGRAEELGAVGQLGGSLVAALERGGMPSSAYRLLTRLSQEHPGLLISNRGSPMDSLGERQRLRALVASGSGLARIGPLSKRESSPAPQALIGWRPAEMLLAPVAGSPTDALVLVSPMTSELGLFVMRPDTGRLEPAWTRKYEPFSPTPLRTDLDVTYLYWPGSRGGWVEAISNADGRTLWKTDEFGSLFKEDAQRPVGERFVVPIAGEVRASDLVVTMDRETLVLVERGGRAAGFDLADGGNLWTGTLRLTRVYDVAGAGDLVVAGGAKDKEKPGENEGEVPPALASFEKRTGREGPAIELTNAESARAVRGEHVRWLRADAAGRVIVGLGIGLACVDPATGATTWDQRAADDQAGIIPGSVAGIVSGDQILVMDGNRQLWLVSCATGDTGNGRLDTEPSNQRKLDFPLRLSSVGDRLVVTGSRGVLIYDKAGKLVGSDATDPDLMLLPPAIGEGMLVTMSQMPLALQRLPGRMLAARDDSVDLFVLEAASGRMIGHEEIVIAEEPSDVMAVDGKVLITAGAITFVLDAPGK